ncbi:TIGR04552 family protein [bacterium]|nr:TIGR04552 family protein [bacterium]
MINSTSTVIPKRAPLNDLSPEEALYISKMSISDLEAIRLVLQGNSVIDWFRLDFKTDDEIELFLKVNGYDIHNIQDQKRLDKIRLESLAYLEDRYPHRIPSELKEPDMTIQRLLYLASRSFKRSTLQMYACMLLKIMHTVNHIDGRELLHRCELRGTDIFTAVERKVENAVRTMQDEGFHIVDFYGSHKDKFSMISKLLAKKENHAAAIYDKIRFRIITSTVADILPMLYFLGRTICPFNYIIPGGSHNNLVSFADLLEHFPSFRHYAAYMKRKNNITRQLSFFRENEHTSAEFRVINFVSDIPIRVDEMLYTPDFIDLGRIIYVTVEFQIMDQMNYQDNEMGEASHMKYKQRQTDAVNDRLGMRHTESR